ncbi:MAG: hypothetical protein Ct9H300mP1_16170 [Planctomycetaceae bacterium]|nr:MAG: hypothetical protein Ct9H300mP1_16170 [Planctomycetaceae bacterium]
MFGRGGQSDQVEVEPAGEGGLVGILGPAEARGFDTREDKVIDRTLWPATVFDRGEGRFGRRLKAQYRRPSSMLISRRINDAVPPLRGSGAPILTQRTRSAICWSESFSLGGISSPSYLTASISRLSPACPAPMPVRFLPLGPAMAAVEQQFALDRLGLGRVAAVALGDQHGRIFFSKNVSCSAVGFGVVLSAGLSAPGAVGAGRGRGGTVRGVVSSWGPFGVRGLEGFPDLF